MDPQFVAVYLQLRLVRVLVYMFGLLMHLSELQRVQVEGKEVEILIIVAEEVKERWKILLLD
jgi:hypothetical protein